jgi:hypothetical protein
VTTLGATGAPSPVLAFARLNVFQRDISQAREARPRDLRQLSDAQSLDGCANLFLTFQIRSDKIAGLSNWLVVSCALLVAEVILWTISLIG